MTDGDAVAVQILLLLLDCLLDDCHGSEGLRLLILVRLSFLLSESGRLLGILILSLHVVILGVQRVNLFLVIDSLLGLLFLQLFHIFL